MARPCLDGRLKQHQISAELEQIILSDNICNEISMAGETCFLRLIMFKCSARETIPPVLLHHIRLLVPSMMPDSVMIYHFALYFCLSKIYMSKNTDHHFSRLFIPRGAIGNNRKAELKVGPRTYKLDLIGKVVS